jgi:hypothetical protein
VGGQRRVQRGGAGLRGTDDEKIRQGHGETSWAKPSNRLTRLFRLGW